MPVAEILWTSASISAPVAFDPCRGSRNCRRDARPLPANRGTSFRYTVIALRASLARPPLTFCFAERLIRQDELKPRARRCAGARRPGKPRGCFALGQRFGELLRQEGRR